MKNKEMLGIIFRKNIKTLGLFVGLFCFLSLNIFPALAITASTTAPTTGQSGAYLNGNQNTAGTGVDGAGNSAVSSLGSCVGGYVSNLVAGVVSGYANSDKYTKLNTTSVNDDAHTGGGVGNYLPSWDSVAYCVINGIIAYIADSTIAWINSGFDGNPAFVEDPGRFFEDIADTEAAGLIQQIAGSTLGVDICQPFRIQIATGLDQGYSRSGYQNTSKCTLDQISNSVQNFSFDTYVNNTAQNSGNLDAWWNISQNPNNNPYGAYLAAQDELVSRINVKNNQATLDLTLGRGFLSFKKCSQDSVDSATGKTIKGACAVTTPGSVIEETLNNRLNSGNQRLVLADKFDQVVSALVGQLIKSALSEVLSNGENTYQYQGN